MANSSPRLPDNRRVIDAIRIGVLTRTYPVSRIQAVLKANEKAFGRPGASRGTAAYPLLRLVGLVENGSHVLFGVQLGRYKTGETTLAKEAVQHLQKDMLCLADREFLSYKLWNEARGRG